MTMATVAPDGTAWSSPAYTLKQIEDKFIYWTEHFIEMKAGTNCVITRAEITEQINRWLDERLALRGR